MIKLSSPKESICFNFENEDQKRFFDKAKKCDIIKNNNSVFLRKILSVKNQSLLNETLKQSKSQIFNHINTHEKDLDTVKSTKAKNWGENFCGDTKMLLFCSRNRRTAGFGSNFLTIVFDK